MIFWKKYGGKLQGAGLLDHGLSVIPNISHLRSLLSSDVVYFVHTYVPTILLKSNTYRWLLQLISYILLPVCLDVNIYIQGILSAQLLNLMLLM